MRNINCTYYTPDRRTLWSLWNLTDLHIGHAACDEKQLRADVETIAADPYAIVMMGGDSIDAINHFDPRFSWGSLAHWIDTRRGDIIEQQVDRAISILHPIRDKIVAILAGNHEHSVEKHTGTNVYSLLATRLAAAKGVAVADIALGYEGYVTLKFRRGKPGPGNFGGTRTITVYLHHGAGGGRKPGSHANRAEDVMLTYGADLTLLGHTHRQMVVDKVTCRPAGKGVRYEKKVAVVCGSYLRSDLDDATPVPAIHYPQVKQLPPLSTGTVPIIIKPDQRLLVPIMTSGQAGSLLDALAQQRIEAMALARAA